MITISLIGHQPIPNLLPLRCQPPDMAILVHTGETANVARRLQRLLERPRVEVRLLPTEAYDVQKIQADLRRFLADTDLEGAELVFNLTGGTKTMMIAAYELAREFKAPFYYLQSEGKRSVLYRYRFEGEKAQYEGKEILPDIITIDDYLKAHLDDPYPQITGPRHPFEEAIGEALKEVVDEVVVGVSLAQALEVDLVVRKGNQVGVIEAKTGSAALKKDGLEHLNAACEQRYLGTYTHKILVINQRWDHTRTNLRELADAWRITVIELPSFTEETPHLSEEDRRYLQDQVVRVLGG